MVKTELYIGSNQMELKPDTVIALTLQIYDLAEMKNYQVNFTNKFSIPKTAGNKKKLGFAGEISSTERAPYKMHDARVITGGIEIVPDGFAIIKETTKDFEIVIYTGLLDLFEKLDGLTLHDLSTLPNYDHDWSLTDAAGSITNTTGYIYPAIQYGAVSAANNNLDIRYSYPSFYINTLSN